MAGIKRDVVEIDGKTSGHPAKKHRVENPTEEQEEITKMAQEGVTESISDEIFFSYQCKMPLKGAQPHPGNIVEAASLAAVSLPPQHYNLSSSIPMDVIGFGRLSELQLEGIQYACQRHQIIFPNGLRAGFFIGDAAGVGKGRQIAGVIFDNYVRGRTRHLWFSISSDLKVDAQRDLEDIGCHVKVIGGCQHLDKETRMLGLPSDFKEGVVFSTYATLISSVQRSGSKRSRLQQIIDWCGGSSFSGCLVFDECHKAKHYHPDNEKSSTKVAVAVTTLQKMLPRARVIYCSATGATSVKNMAFMERLGLWGEGTAFKSFETFLDSINRRGLGASEMLAMEMKTSGMYLARELSFREAEFTFLEVDLSDEQICIYNVASHIWDELRKSLDHAQARTESSSRLGSIYWGAHQRFFKQLCLSVKVPAIVEETKAALKAGHCVVIGLQTTGEASLDHCVLSSDGQSLGEFVSLTKEILCRFIENNFPTERKTNQNKVEKDDWCVTAKKMLLDYIEKCNFPISPLDDIIDQLGGPSHVAEMTGRKGRVVRDPMGKPRYQRRESDVTGDVESLNVNERNNFMQGKKLVAIISDAASTGISLHADRRVPNQRRRIHVTFELPWSAEKAVQQLGRSHRSNQATAPIYKLLTTSLGGERRFASAVAQRLQSLGALTKGDRRASGGLNVAQFNFDTPYGRSALRSMYESISRKELVSGVSLSSLGGVMEAGGRMTFGQINGLFQECLVQMGVADTISGGILVQEKNRNDVGKFLNRVLGLKVLYQNWLFGYFSACLDATIDIAKKEGRYNEGVTDIVAASIQLKHDPELVFTEGRPSNQQTKHYTVIVDRGVDFDSAVERLEKAGGRDSGFYVSRREQRGRRLHLLAIQKPRSPHLFTIVRPNTGLSASEEERSELMHKYGKVSAKEAEVGWRKQYDSTRNQCIHGSACKLGPGNCKIGSRITEVHLLNGGLIPIWSALESTLLKRAESLDLGKNERSLRVVRLLLDSGERLIGMRYPHQLIPEVTELVKNPPPQQEHLQGVSAPLHSPQSGSISLLKVEQESPVLIKLLRKAQKPPVTLHDFFSSKAARTKSTPGPATSKQQPIIDLDAPPIVCPVCEKALPRFLTNVEVNAHVDRCLGK